MAALLLWLLPDDIDNIFAFHSVVGFGTMMIRGSLRGLLAKIKIQKLPSSALLRSKACCHFAFLCFPLLCQTVDSRKIFGPKPPLNFCGLSACHPISSSSRSTEEKIPKKTPTFSLSSIHSRCNFRSKPLNPPEKIPHTDRRRDTPESPPH